MEQLEFQKAICYSGYRKGQSPKTEIPTKEQIAEDIQILVNDGYHYLRMYDPNLHARRVLEVIRENNYPVKCLIGIDSDPEINNKNCPWEVQNFSEEELLANKTRNDNELVKLIELVKEFPDEVFAVSVGNENTPSWGAHLVSEERLIEHADKLKKNLDKPVTFCEGYFEWPQLTELSKHLDFISLHTYPYHYGDAVSEAINVNKKHFYDTKALFPDKPVVITELGWSSNTTDEAARSRANIDNQKAYIEDVQKWVDE